MAEKERSKAVESLCLGDYFSLSLFAGGAQARAAVSLRFTGSTFSLQNAFRCYTPHPNPNPSRPAQHHHTNAITTHQSNE